MTGQEQHRHAGGSAGGLGENSAECSCGVTYAGFDTHAEAAALIDQHIAASNRPRGYRGRRRRPNLLHAVLDAVMDFGAALTGRPTESPQRGYGGGVKRAAGAPAPRNTTDPGPGGVPQTPPPDSAETPYPPAPSGETQ